MFKSRSGNQILDCSPVDPNQIFTLIFPTRQGEMKHRVRDVEQGILVVRKILYKEPFSRSSTPEEQLRIWDIYISRTLPRILLQQLCNLGQVFRRQLHLSS
jgi:hypothetical protein